MRYCGGGSHLGFSAVKNFAQGLEMETQSGKLHATS